MTAAGNQDMASGEHTGFIAGQECDRAGDILGIEMLFQRPSFPSLAPDTPSGMIIDASVSVKAGVTTLTAMPQRPELDRHGVRHRLERGLCCGISSHARQRLLRQSRADDDDSAGFFPSSPVGTRGRNGKMPTSSCSMARVKAFPRKFVQRNRRRKENRRC